MNDPGVTNQQLIWGWPISISNVELLLAIRIHRKHKKIMCGRSIWFKINYFIWQMFLKLFSDNKPSESVIWALFCLWKNEIQPNVASKDKRFYGQMNTPAYDTYL